ncbi:hypothetical protein KAU92_01230 [Candidatus Bathyarchaeota archaeon]|nr:hypothetical protein [Candidatus Bathyarchaeota archaeon]
MEKHCKICFCFSGYGNYSVYYSASEKIHLTLIATAIGGIIYLALLIAIDKEARLLVRSMWQEIRFKGEGVVA